MTPDRLALAVATATAVLAPPSRAAAQVASATVAADAAESVPARLNARYQAPTSSVEMVFVADDNEPAQLLVWGPRRELSTCTLPCGMTGDSGQYGVTVSGSRRSWSVGFVLASNQRLVRVRLRAPSGARVVGGGFMIAFGALASSGGLGTGITALTVAGSSAGALLGLVIALPLLAAGVPLLVGGVFLAAAGTSAALVDSPSMFDATRARGALNPDAGALFAPPLFTVRF